VFADQSWTQNGWWSARRCKSNLVHTHLIKKNKGFVQHPPVEELHAFIEAGLSLLVA
jgi:hypothetical protein